MTTIQTRRRRRSSQTAEPHAVHRRASERFKPVSNVFGLLDTGPEAIATEHLQVYVSTPNGRGRQLETFAPEPSWRRDFYGQLTYFGHGRIEEIDDDNDNNAHDMTTPRPLPSLSSLPDSAGARNTFGIPITDPLPPSTTPPPCPPLNVLSISVSSTMQPNFYADATFPFKPSSVVRVQPPSQSVLDTGTEIALLHENLKLLSTVDRDLQMMCTWFYAQTPVETFSDHIDTCGVIEESIKSILGSLNIRRKLGEEEWNVRSARWHEKYSERMYSLQRTLLRLLSIRPTVERRKLKPHHITLVSEKLMQHHLKLNDLATKFMASFDRLQLRHIHYLLVQAHTQAHQKQEARRTEEETFERQWYEDKAIRADLRKEFFAHRTTRQPSAQ